MSLDNEYLEYPKKRYGMDHDRYNWSILQERPAINWPSHKKLAIWVNVCLEFFPLNQSGTPFPPSGGMTMPYPDLRHFSLRDYGNRVGIYRILKALDAVDAKATFSINGQLAERIPYLMDMLKERGDEIIAYGWNMDSIHHSGMSLDEEKALIERTIDKLSKYSNENISGWLSPSRNESENTPELLASAGLSYFCDWVNDDMPYLFRTDNGELWAMPLSNELDDAFIMMNNLHSEQSYLDQICDAADFLLNEAQTEGGRILALNVHPWMSGQPHRISKLEAALHYIRTLPDVWFANGTDIVNIVSN